MKCTAQLLVLIALATSCKQTERREDPKELDKTAANGEQAQREPPREQPPTLQPEEISWRSEKLEAIGLEVPVIDGVELVRSAMNDSSYVRQARSPIMTSIWYGPGRNIESWRRGFANNPNATLSEPETATVCGKQATLQEVSKTAMRVPYRPIAAAAPAETVALADPSREPAHTADDRRRWQEQGYREVPARTTVAMFFKQGGTEVAASWIVDTEHRTAFKKAEQRFFAGFSCP